LPDEDSTARDVDHRRTGTARRSGRRAAFLLVPTALCLLSGCSGQGGVESQNAVDAALRFTTAARDDPSAACGLLAPGTRQELEDQDGPCASALPDQDLPQASGPGTAEVYGKDAIVRLRGDTLFLARFADGWHVTAAGCLPAGQDKPYTCTVKGV
jgi:hypothetical protein